MSSFNLSSLSDFVCNEFHIFPFDAAFTASIYVSFDVAHSNFPGTLLRANSNCWDSSMFFLLAFGISYAMSFIDFECSTWRHQEWNTIPKLHIPIGNSNGRDTNRKREMAEERIKYLVKWWANHTAVCGVWWRVIIIFIITSTEILRQQPKSFVFIYEVSLHIVYWICCVSECGVKKVERNDASSCLDWQIEILSSE